MKVLYSYLFRTNLSSSEFLESSAFGGGGLHKIVECLSWWEEQEREEKGNNVRVSSFVWIQK